MRLRSRTFSSVGNVLVAAIAYFCPNSANAQSVGIGRTLGGYGAVSGLSDSGMGGGAMIIPYGGRTEGFMPGRMGGGSPLSFRPRPSVGTNSRRTSFSFSPLSGEMAGGSRATSGGMASGIGARSSMFGSTGLRSVGPGGSSFRLGTGGGGMSVMPPSIGYPFRQPASILGSSAGAGTSM